MFDSQMIITIILFLLDACFPCHYLYSIHSNFLFVFNQLFRILRASLVFLSNSLFVVFFSSIFIYLSSNHILIITNQANLFNRIEFVLKNIIILLYHRVLLQPSFIRKIELYHSCS